ncbi:MAG: hypothetical protein H0W88_05090 [Parachlamydiaceae bacterium]|nr:hypothetical protein [Parachlamydiaceae bacterium]
MKSQEISENMNSYQNINQEMLSNSHDLLFDIKNIYDGIGILDISKELNKLKSDQEKIHSVRMLKVASIIMTLPILLLLITAIIDFSLYLANFNLRISSFIPKVIADSSKTIIPISFVPLKLFHEAYKKNKSKSELIALKKLQEAPKFNKAIFELREWHKRQLCGRKCKEVAQNIKDCENFLVNVSPDECAKIKTSIDLAKRILDTFKGQIVELNIFLKKDSNGKLLLPKATSLA